MGKRVDIYRSGKKSGAYLYVNDGQALDELPETLLGLLGHLELAMTLTLTEDKKLAQSDVRTVLKNLDDKGYYLQMPPSVEAYMQKIPNDKLY